MKNLPRRSFLNLLPAAALLRPNLLMAAAPTSPLLEAVRVRVLPGLKKNLSARKLAAGAAVYLRIFKESKELELWMTDGGRQWQRFKTYPVATWGGGTLGPKLKEGDGQAPEGCYTVGAAQLNPNSKYHLAFNLGYPNAFDSAHGRTGSFLMVHGSEVSIGCFAMTDAGIEEIYLLAEAALNGGQREFAVHIFPFRMTAERLAKEAQSPWRDFWANLREGWDLFEKSKSPPAASVRNKRYVFTAP